MTQTNDLTVSDSFRVFQTEAPRHAAAWQQAVMALGDASALDEKTEALTYLAVIAGLGFESGVPFHVGLAKAAGASRDEVVSAVLVGLPAAGQIVIRSLPVALSAYDARPEAQR